MSGSHSNAKGSKHQNKSPDFMMSDQEAAISSFSYSKPKASSSNPSTLPSTPTPVSIFNRSGSDSNRNVKNISTSSHPSSNSSNATLPSHNKGFTQASSASKPPVDIIGSRRNVQHDFFPSNRSASPAQNVAGGLRASNVSRAPALGLPTRVNSSSRNKSLIDNNESRSNVKVRDHQLADQSSPTPSSKQVQVAVVSSNKRRHDAEEGRQVENVQQRSLQEAPQRSEQEQASVKRHKMVSSKTGTAALKPSTFDSKNQQASSHASSELDNQSTGRESVDSQFLKSAGSGSFGNPKNQMQIDGNTSHQGNDRALVRSFSRDTENTLTLSEPVVGQGNDSEDQIPGDWFSGAMSFNGRMLTHLAAGHLERQALEVNLTKISHSLKHLRISHADNNSKLAFWEKDFGKLLKSTNEYQESAEAAMAFSKEKAALAAQHVGIFGNELISLKKARQQQLPEIGSGNYDLDSEFISVRQQYFQTTRELESKVEGAGKKVVAQSEAADKARAELVEAKKKIDILESRIRLQQESLDIKTNRVVDAQAAEAESGATVKRLRSEIDEVTIQYREMEAELAVKEAEMTNIKSRNDELSDKNAASTAWIATNKTKITSLGYEKSELNLQLSLFEQKLAKLSQDVASATEAHKTASDFVDVLQKEKEDGISRFDELTQSARDLRQKISASEKALLEVESKLTVASQKLRATEALLEKATKDAESLRGETARAVALTGDLAKEKAKVASIKASTSLAEQEITSIRQRLDKERESNRDRVGENAKLVESLTAQLANEKKLASERQEKVGSLQVEKQTLQKERARYNLQAAEIEALKERSKENQIRIAELTSELEEVRSLEETSKDENAQEILRMEKRAQELNQIAEEKRLEIQAVYDARASFCSRVAKGEVLPPVELELYNTIGTSRTGPLRKECYKLSNSVKSLESQLESERKKSEAKLAKLQKEMQDRESKLRALGAGSKKQKPHIELPSLDSSELGEEREEAKAQEPQVQESPSVNRVRSIERSSSRARGFDETDSVQMIDPEDYSVSSQQRRSAMVPLASSSTRQAPSGILRQGGQAQAGGDGQTSQTQRPQRRTQRVQIQTTTRSYGVTRR